MPSAERKPCSGCGRAAMIASTSEAVGGSGALRPGDDAARGPARVAAVALWHVRGVRRVGERVELRGCEATRLAQKKTSSVPWVRRRSTCLPTSWWGTE